MKQWMLRITAYADRLLEDLEDLDWPEAIKKMQRDWIGRSEGAEVRFLLHKGGAGIEVFTTRPDTLFGATYMVLAPEHALVESITTADQRDAVDAYVEETRRKSERVRSAENREKTGVDTGAFAINPCNGERIPVWIADYVLSTYGTGAIMAVPGHDERDFEFAQSFGLEIRKVVEVAGKELPTAVDGVATASDFLDGLDTQAAKRRMIEWLEAEGHGKGTVTYKLRDWLFSRQRYWGEPFPVLHSDGETSLVPDESLPLLIPELDDFRPTGEQQTPLERVRDWIETTLPGTGLPARRDPNTMPQWAGSCWYFLRFCDPDNSEALVSEEAERYWMPVDLYVGGAEHAVLHLLYSRFWHKFLYDIGVVHTAEPFQKLVNQGMILGSSYRYFDDNLSDDPDASVRRYAADQVRVSDEGTFAAEDGRELKARWVGPLDVARGPAPERAPMHPSIPDLVLEEVVEKMSKSRGNVINPDDVVGEFGADSIRLYEMFLGPLDKDAPWSTDGIQGVFRFLQRTWRLFHENRDSGETPRSMSPGAGNKNQARLAAQTVQGVSEDLDAMQFNTAISKLMVFVRDIAKEAPLTVDAAETFLKLLAPFAPHLAEELWDRTGHADTISYEPWPVADPALLAAESIVLAVQVNGKRRDEIEVPADAEAKAIEAAALASEAVRRHLGGREPKKVIVVPGRLVNVVC
jgi:leucyl-tRNA synthetase